MREDKPGLDLVRQIVSDISQMHYEGDIAAIACVIVRKDGDLRALNANVKGTVLPLLAGTVVLQKQVFETMNHDTAGPVP